MIHVGAMILAAVLAVRDGETKGVVVKVEETQLDGGRVKLVVVLKTEKGEQRFHVPYARTEDGWGIDPKLAELARGLQPGDKVVIGWWDGDGVKIIKFIERIRDEAKDEADKKDKEPDKNHEPDKKDREPDKKELEKKKEAERKEAERKEAEKREAEKKDGGDKKKDGEKKDWEKKKEAERKEAERREAEKAKDLKVRGKIVRIIRDRNGEGELAKVGIELEVEKRKIVIWVPYKKIEARWAIDREILKQVDRLQNGWVVTIGYYVAEEAKFIKWIEVNEDGGEGKKD